ncbi:unnamed protein product [Sphacelaria rigidula]
MARKRKRPVSTPRIDKGNPTSTGKGEPVKTTSETGQLSTPSAGGCEQTTPTAASPTLQSQAVAEHGGDVLQGQATGFASDDEDGVRLLQPHVARDKDSDSSDDNMVGGIPWALPKEPAASPGGSDVRVDRRSDAGQGDSGGDNADRYDASSSPMGGASNRFKMRPNTRKAGTKASGRGRAKDTKNSRRNDGGGISDNPGGNSWARDSGNTGASDRREHARDEYYIPQEGPWPPRPCTVFTPTPGKVRRFGNSAAEATALVVGLDAGEQLCFVGSARIRCGQGRADITGFTLLPVPWGPYLEVHSPRWTSLQVIRALHAEERLDMRQSSFLTSGGGRVAGMATTGGVHGASEGEEDDSEGKVEEAIDELAQEFAVVIALRPLADGPLNFLSAQGDGDLLYASDIASDKPRDTASAPNMKLAEELRLPGMQVVVSPSSGLHPFVVPQDWADAVSAIMKAPPAAPAGGNTSVLVCGAKGVGKSSFCRFLTNRMLDRHAKVAFLDCDVGQPEFTPPGLVSLHTLDGPVLGPPHTHIRRPDLAYYIGTTTSKPEPLLYSAAVRGLSKHATAMATEDAGSLASDTSPPPLVVNTDGWVKGMGEDLLGAIIDAVRPLHIVQILGTSAARQFDLDRLPQNCQVHPIEAYSTPANIPGYPPAPARPSARDSRTLRLVSYFVGCDSDGHGVARDRAEMDTEAGENHLRGDIFPGYEKGESLIRASASSFWPGGATVRGGALYDQRHEVAALLSRRKPRRVPWGTVRIRVMNGPVPPSLALYAINGTLVGLIAHPGGESEAARYGLNAVEPGLVCLPETPLSPCVGLGIVRSVDVERRVLYILTPEPLEVLKEVNVLVKGSLQLPMEMLYDPSWCSHPYFSAEAVGGEVIKTRNNLLRRT